MQNQGNYPPFVNYALELLGTLTNRLQGLREAFDTKVENVEQTSTVPMWTRSVTPPAKPYFSNVGKMKGEAGDVQDKLDECGVLMMLLRNRLRKRHTLTAVPQVFVKRMLVIEQTLQDLQKKMLNVQIDIHIKRENTHKETVASISFCGRRANEIFYLLSLIEHEMDFSFEASPDEQQVEAESRLRHFRTISRIPQPTTFPIRGVDEHYRKYLNKTLKELQVKLAKAQKISENQRFWKKLEEAQQKVTDLQNEGHIAPGDKNYIDTVEDFIEEIQSCKVRAENLKNEMENMMSDLNVAPLETVKQYRQRLPELEGEVDHIVETLDDIKDRVTNFQFGVYDYLG